MNDQPVDSAGTTDGSAPPPKSRRGVMMVWGGLAVAAVAVVGAYFAFSAAGNDGDGDEQSVGQQGPGEAVEQTGIVNALEKEGILPEETDPADVQGALIRGASGQPGGKHDNGQHATFTQVRTLDGDDLLKLFPTEYVSVEGLPALKQEILAARAFAETVDTVEKASAAGFYQATNDVPFMGEHWLSRAYLTDGVFDASKPEGLLFSTIDGERKLVGVWYLQIPGIGSVKPDVEPTGFTTDLDLWHAHLGLCIVKLSGASEGETRASCEEKGGSFTADLRWMMHVWVAPEATENERGVFAYLNTDLFAKQQAQKKAAEQGAPSGTTAD
jgi:hypothetical protein